MCVPLVIGVTVWYRYYIEWYIVSKCNRIGTIKPTLTGPTLYNNWLRRQKMPISISDCNAIRLKLYNIGSSCHCNAIFADKPDITFRWESTLMCLVLSVMMMKFPTVKADDNNMSGTWLLVTNEQGLWLYSHIYNYTNECHIYTVCMVHPILKKKPATAYFQISVKMRK